MLNKFLMDIFRNQIKGHTRSSNKSICICLWVLKFLNCNDIFYSINKTSTEYYSKSCSYYCIRQKMADHKIMSLVISLLKYGDYTGSSCLIWDNKIQAFRDPRP